MAVFGSCSEIGNAVALARKSMHMTQRQLADAAGVGVRFIVDLEAGKETVRLGLVLAVLSTLNFSFNLEEAVCSPINTVA